MLVLLMLILFMSLNMNKNPFYTVALNELETLSLVTSFLSVFCAIFFIVSPKTTDIDTGDSTTTLSNINICFIQLYSLIDRGYKNNPLCNYLSQQYHILHLLVLQNDDWDKDNYAQQVWKALHLRISVRRQSEVWDEAQGSQNERGLWVTEREIRRHVGLSNRSVRQWGTYT